jgi:Prohead core protein serine protease
MKLIREDLHEAKLIVEDKGLGKGKNYFIEGIFLQSNLVNRNKRMYTEEVMDKEVARYLQEQVKTNRAYGELGHPDTPSINLDRVSHLIVDLRKEGTNYIGRAKILETPMGQIARGLLDGGANLGVSSRALGSLKMNEDGVNVVQDDFMLSTAADIVADPSAPDAFVRGIMENKEWTFVDGKFVEKHIEEVKTIIKKASSRDLQEAKIVAFAKFLSKIK